MRVKIIVVSLLCLALGSIGPKAGAESSKPSVDRHSQQYQIVFTDFDITNAGNYSYLKNSIQGMLASRLAAKDRVNILDQTFTERELFELKKRGNDQVLSVGGERADYLVTGTLFELTSGLETQVELYPLTVENPVMHFSVLSTTPDTLITDIEQLANNISHKAFGEPVIEPGTPSAEGDSGFVTVHPEAAYKKNLYSGTVIGVTGSGVKTRGRGAKLKTSIAKDMKVMAVGDVDGDGSHDILSVSGSNLILFKTTSKTIKIEAETKLPRTLDIHAMNVADLDNDGRDEIYISATRGLNVSSMVLRYSGKTFETVVAHVPWYLRPLEIPSEGWRLLGQRRGVEKTALVRPGIFQLSLNGKTMSSGKRLPLPASLNLFDFVYADLDGDSFSEIIAVDQKEKLRVYNPGNELMWVSKKNYGSSKVYLGPSRGGIAFENQQNNFTPDEDVDRDLIFVPGGILVTDIDNDGKQELVVNEGKKIGLSVFNKLRFYDGGAVVSLAWNGTQLNESWRTGNFSGHLAGYGFKLADNIKDVQNMKNNPAGPIVGRLFVGTLPASGSLSELLPGGGKTELSVYDLEFILEKGQKAE